jgi:hypothetical protein
MPARAAASRAPGPATRSARSVMTASSPDGVASPQRRRRTCVGRAPRSLVASDADPGTR